MTPEQAEVTDKLIDLSDFITKHFAVDKQDAAFVQCIDYLEEQREELKDTIDIWNIN